MQSQSQLFNFAVLVCKQTICKQTNGHGSVAIKLYLKEQAADLFWSSLLTPALEYKLHDSRDLKQKNPMDLYLLSRTVPSTVSMH